jgi:hypothetical protein
MTKLVTRDTGTMREGKEDLGAGLEQPMQRSVSRRSMVQSAALLLGSSAVSGLETHMAWATVTPGESDQKKQASKPAVIASDKVAVTETARGRVRRDQRQ